MSGRKSKTDNDQKNEKNEGKRRSSKKYRNEKPETNVGDSKPLPPNVFVYIQLASIKSLPKTNNLLEIHMTQGDSVIVKCVEHYNTDGIIYQAEFNDKPTYTLIVPQDNIDRINQISDFPLLIQLYMRVPPPKETYETNEEETFEDVDVEQLNATDYTTDTFIQNTGNVAFNAIAEEENSLQSNVEGHLELLSVGYIDLLKLCTKRRNMLKSELYLYSVPTVSQDLRITTRSEWHLYTLLPIIKEISLVNFAFIAFESIYNISPYNFTAKDELVAQLYFVSTKPDENNEFEKIPLCEFRTMTMNVIDEQPMFCVFESLRNKENAEIPMHALNTKLRVEIHKLFHNLMRNEDNFIDYDFIDMSFDQAFICNSLHRFVLTEELSRILFEAISCGEYVIGVDIINISEPQHKIFDGTIDLSLMAFPNVQNVRFAVTLNYAGPRNSLSKRSIKFASLKSEKVPLSLTPFAIIKICLFAPIGVISEHVMNLSETFAIESRLQSCMDQPKEQHPVPIEDIRSESYSQFDRFIKKTISYIVDKCVHTIEQKEEHFCCVIHNLVNILLKLVGSDFNYRVPTKTNVEFSNVCVDAYNALELRIHSILEKITEIDLRNSVVNTSKESEKIIEYMNSIKFLSLVNDQKMINFFYDKIESETKLPDKLKFYKLIFDMEQKNYDSAKEYYRDSRKEQDLNAYFVGWIKLYLDYMDNKSNEETAKDALEFLLRDITTYAEQYSRKTDGWILLYCYYKHYKYHPGSNYARWQCDDYYTHTRDSLAEAPYSIAGSIVSNVPKFSTPKGTLFFEVIRVFVRLGCYEFTQIVFDEIKHECKELELYLNQMSLHIIHNTLDEKISIRTFPTSNSEEDTKLNALANQVNGYLEYYRGNLDKAENWFMRNINLPSSEENRDFFLSTICLAYMTFDRGAYRTTIRVLSKPVYGRVMGLIVNMMLGRAYYKLGEEKTALEHFARCTEYGVHMPDTWGYLALINMHEGKTYNALECWKYAKVDPVCPISEEIYEALEEIDYDDVDLYIDIN